MGNRIPKFIAASAMPNHAEAQRLEIEHRVAFGLSASAVPLLTLPDGNTKTAKSLKAGTYSLILHLAPSTVGGVGNVCPWSTRGCRKACLNTAGHGSMDLVQAARIWRTRFFAEHPGAFMRLVVEEIMRARRIHPNLAVRLNGTSDIRWEAVTPWLFTLFAEGPKVQFYDYTKSLERANLSANNAGWPSNYDLTYSLTEMDSDGTLSAAIRMGIRTAVVFDHMPAKYDGHVVVDGDADDLRFTEPHGVVVGLLAKGAAKHDTSGFVRRAS